MTRVYVGNLPIDVKEREVEDFFYKYGKITNVSVKIPSRPPAFAFITFDDDRDAEDAVRGRDGVEFLGSKIRVEIAKSSGGGSFGGSRRDEGRGGGRGGGYDRGGASDSRPFTDSRLAVVVTGLPRSASWQDLKDFGRSAGDVKRSNVYGGGEGVLEYSNESDADHAIRSLDDTEFKNRYDKAYVRVRRASDSSRKRSYSRSRSPSRDRSRSRDRYRGGRDRDRSRSRGSDRSNNDRRDDKRSSSKAAKTTDDDDRRSD